MRILITQRALLHWAGSEMVTIEIANGLSARGHQVAVFCPRIGSALANLMLPSGVWVKSRLSEIPWVPDIVHGHHHLQAMAALSYFVDTPAIYYCHGVIPWPEQVPIHPRICKYVVMCGWMAPRLEPDSGIARDRIAVVPNFVNTKRFSNVRTPPGRAVRALLFGGGGFSSDELLLLEKVCMEQGLSLEKIGYAYGNPQARPEAYLPNYDLVFAIGKCAIEAMACGCAVIPVVPGQAGHLITSDNFDDWAYSNFSPRYFAAATRVSADWLKEELERYSPEAVAQVTARLRSTRSLLRAVDQLETIYTNAVDEHRRTESNAARNEFAPYLEKISAEADVLWESADDVERLRAVIATKERMVTESRERMSGLYQANEHLRHAMEKLHTETRDKEQNISGLRERITQLCQINDEQNRALNSRSVRSVLRLYRLWRRVGRLGQLP